jgi:hypothetical protein
MPSAAAQGTLPTFRGGHYRSNAHTYQFLATALGKHISLGSFKPAEAETGARMYDALQLLLYGPRALTNFEWSSYAQADIAAAAQLLQEKGLDVHQAVIFARQKYGREWYGVSSRAVSWIARVKHACNGRASQDVNVAWYGLPSAEAAARQADAGRLAIIRRGCTTNFPASSYTKLQLEEAGRHATSKGVEAAHLAACLEAVEQVCSTVAGPACNACWCVFAYACYLDCARIQSVQLQHACIDLVLSKIGSLTQQICWHFDSVVCGVVWFPHLFHRAFVARAVCGVGQLEVTVAVAVAWGHQSASSNSEVIARCLPPTPQARQDGTLDERVVSLQARKELFKALDLIPPEYTFEAASAAVQAAPCNMPVAMRPTSKPSQGKNRDSSNSGQQRNGSSTSTGPSNCPTDAAAAAALDPSCTAAGWDDSQGPQGLATGAPRTRGRPPATSYSERVSGSEPEEDSDAESGPESSRALLPNARAAAEQKRKLPAESHRIPPQQLVKHSRYVHLAGGQKCIAICHKNVTCCEVTAQCNTSVKPSVSQLA